MDVVGCQRIALHPAVDPGKGFASTSLPSVIWAAKAGLLRDQISIKVSARLKNRFIGGSPYAKVVFRLAAPAE